MMNVAWLKQIIQLFWTMEEDNVQSEVKGLFTDISSQLSQL